VPAATFVRSTWSSQRFHTPCAWLRCPERDRSGRPRQNGGSGVDRRRSLGAGSVAAFRSRPRRDRLARAVQPRGPPAQPWRPMTSVPDWAWAAARIGDRAALGLRARPHPVARRLGPSAVRGRRPRRTVPGPVRSRSLGCCAYRRRVRGSRRDSAGSGTRRPVLGIATTTLTTVPIGGDHLRPAG
jgi:hypothetical protein